MDVQGLLALIAQQNADLVAAVNSLVVSPQPDPLQAQLDAANKQVASQQAEIDAAKADIEKAAADLSPAQPSA